jgi:hypothetical protein
VRPQEPAGTIDPVYDDELHVLDPPLEDDGDDDPPT